MGPGKSLIGETDWYELVWDDDGFYSISILPGAPEDVPMVDVEGADITSVTYGALFFNTWDELSVHVDRTEMVMDQLSQLEELMHDDAIERGSLIMHDM